MAKQTHSKIGSRFDMTRFFQALGDGTRLRLLNLIGGQEICVCYLVEVLGVPQPKISRHLAYLRSAGLVGARREGKWMHYRILVPDHAGAASILRETLAWMLEDAAMGRDRVRLRKAVSGSQGLVSLLGAPVPAPVG
jgi:ArsR family transcriptional regulator